MMSGQQTGRDTPVKHYSQRSRYFLRLHDEAHRDYSQEWSLWGWAELPGLCWFLIEPGPAALQGRGRRAPLLAVDALEAVRLLATFSEGQARLLACVPPNDLAAGWGFKAVSELRIGADATQLLIRFSDGAEQLLVEGDRDGGVRATLSTLYTAPPQQLYRW